MAPIESLLRGSVTSVKSRGAVHGSRNRSCCHQRIKTQSSQAEKAEDSVSKAVASGLHHQRAGENVRSNRHARQPLHSSASRHGTAIGRSPEGQDFRQLEGYAVAIIYLPAETRRSLQTASVFRIARMRHRLFTQRSAERREGDVSAVLVGERTIPRIRARLVELGIGEKGPPKSPGEKLREQCLTANAVYSQSGRGNEHARRKHRAPIAGTNRPVRTPRRRSSQVNVHTLRRKI